MADAQNPTTYKFVDGNGDDAHADALNLEAQNGFRAILMEFDPDAPSPVANVSTRRLVVLMQKP